MFDKFLSLTARCALWIATLSMTAMVLMTVTDVTLRYLFKAPLPATTEFIQIFMAIIVFSGMVIVGRDGSHVVVSLFEPWLERYVPWLSRTLYVLAYAVGTAFLTYVLARTAIQDFQFGEVSMVMQYPLWYLAAAATCLILLALLQVWHVAVHGPSGHGSVD